MTITAVDKYQIALEVKKILQELYKERLVDLILYGSYARGEQHADSDMDFLLILKDEKINRYDEMKRIAHHLYSLEQENELFLSVHIRSCSDWQNQNSLYLNNVKKDGILI